jgi:hypothetical protein
MIGYQDKINQILRGAETIKNTKDNNMGELTIDTSNWDKVNCTDNALTLFEPNHTIALFNKVHKEVGKLDFNGDKLKFEGDVEESAKIFFDFLLSSFNQRIEEIREESYKEGYSDAEWHNQAP